jgi:hypothetical protein
MAAIKLQAGVAEVEITPKAGVILAGEFGPTTASTLDSPLMVKVLVLDDGRQRLLIIGLDLLGLDATIADEWVKEAAIKAGIKSQAVMIICSHTRCAPYSAVGVGSTGLDQNFLTLVKGKLLQAVEQAVTALQPAALGVGKVTLPHLIYNHRLLTRNMKAISAWLGVPKNEVLAPEGATDPDLSVIVVRDGHGFPLCLLWSYAADHRPKSSGAISAGLPGLVQAQIDARLGRHIPLVYLAGCGGSTSYIQGEGASADAVASGVIAAYLETSGDPSLRLSCADEAVIVPVRDSREFWAQADIQLKYPAVEAVFAKEAELMQASGERAVKTRVQVFRLGRFALVGLPGIPFAGFGLAIKAASPAGETVVAANNGGYLGVVATREAFAAGGYETWASRANKVGPGAGEFLVERAVELLKGLWKI